MKKRLAHIALALCLLLSGTLLPSCQKNEKYTTYSFDYFDTVTTVVGYAKSQEEFDRISSDILSELAEYHRLFTVYQRYEGLENLCTVNELVDGAHRTVSVDRRIIDLLLYAKQMYRLTDGKVNVAMGSVLSIWHDYREAGRSDPTTAQLPPIEQLRQAAEHTDIEQLIIDEQECTVTLKDPAMRLDVGAIAKGYAVEMVARSLQSKGIEGYVINVGGNVRTVGPKGDGQPWTVGIENPQEGEPYLAYLEIADLSLVTSGSYQRYYIVNGENYHHIIDPVTLMPAEGYRSISIVCQSSAMADALSTALFCMPQEQGQDLIRSLPDVEAMWVMKDGSIYFSDGFAEHQIK